MDNPKTEDPLDDCVVSGDPVLDKAYSLKSKPSGLDDLLVIRRSFSGEEKEKVSNFFSKQYKNRRR